MLKTNCFAIVLCGLLLFSCSNANNDKNNQTIPTVENTKNSSYEYSIGLSQTVYISITDVMQSIEKSKGASDFLNIFEEGISLTGLNEDSEEIDCVSLRLTLGGKKLNNCSLKDGGHTIAITCEKQFESIAISKIKFTFKEKRFDLKTNIKFKFDDSYQTNPYLLDSYAMESRWWYSNAMLLETDRLPYAYKNLESFRNGYFHVYDGVHHLREYETIILNGISFSNNLKNYVNKVEYALFDTNTNPFAFDESKIEFSLLDKDINVKEITNDNTELYFRFSTSELNNQAFLGGDIIYDVTINGINYSISRMFLIHSYLLL